jgi:hypothetical protein
LGGANMCEKRAKTKLDTAVYFLPVILLTFGYFYLYLPGNQLLIFSIMALKLTLLLLIWNIVHVCVVFSKSIFFAACLTDFENYIFLVEERFTD